MLRDRVTPPMNSQKPGRASGQRAVVVDMSNMTPAAPPCMTSSRVELESVKRNMARTVQIGEVGRYKNLIRDCSVETRIHKLQVLHDLAVKVLSML